MYTEQLCDSGAHAFISFTSRCKLVTQKVRWATVAILVTLRFNARRQRILSEAYGVER
jgi:hypothetical protein